MNTKENLGKELPITDEFDEFKGHLACEGRCVQSRRSVPFTNRQGVCII